VHAQHIHARMPAYVTDDKPKSTHTILHKEYTLQHHQRFLNKMSSHAQHNITLPTLRCDPKAVRRNQ